MTVTKRKARDDAQVVAPTLESGIKASCDNCSADVTHSVHVRCAVCSDFDLCVPCFLAGKQVGPHRATHSYRIISSHAFPIFNRDWGADEELLLIEGAELYGLGNWADMAEHVGGRTKEECEKHYMDTYIWSEDYPLPVVGSDFGSQDDFQTRKKRRLEDLQAQPLALPPPKPLASAPTCHEIGGFMPGRLEFETEYENEAETLIKDMEFGKVYQFGGDSQPAAPPPVSSPTKEKEEAEEEGGGEGEKSEDQKPEAEVVVEEVGDEDENELELKMAILEMFNERFDRRVASKELIFDRGLLNYKQLLANEKKKSKEERDLINRTKVFARVQTALDHEKFVDGLTYETILRKRIAELQEYRRMGVTTLAEGERYDHAKSQRMSAKAASFRDSMTLSYDRVASRGARAPGATADRKSITPRPPATALTLSTSASLHLLTPLEQQLCSTLRILPRPYLFLKEVLLREWVRTGGKMGASDARKAVASIRDPSGAKGEWGEKVDRVWEFLVDSGGLRKGNQSADIDDDEDAEGDMDADADGELDADGEEDAEGELDADGEIDDADGIGNIEADGGDEAAGDRMDIDGEVDGTSGPAVSTPAAATAMV